MRKYTIDQVNAIISQQGWSSCECKNEKVGEECIGTDTIQVAFEDDGEYFGEFVGKDNEFEFIFYV